MRDHANPANSVVALWFVFVCSMAGCATGVDSPAATEPEATAAAVDTDPAPATDQEVPRGLSVARPEAAPGYVFFNPLLSFTTYLVDLEGQVVHTWESELESGGGAYLLDNGHLLRGGQEPDPPVFSGGGQAGRIQETTWDGEVVWDFRYADENRLLHHDMAVLPNGNILAIAWEAKTAEEAAAAGRRPELIPEAGLWPDMIVEIEPQPPDGGRIVWEWHTWDHMIQNVDPDLPHYGDPAEHPERIDINGDQDAPEMTSDELARLQALGYVPDDTTQEDLQSDFMHSNAIAYNPALDQIAVSVRHFHEIWIIDHSTTTEQAAGSSGGRWGRGGDLLYRWGNPKNYGRGTADDQRLFGQHDIRWVSEGMPGSGQLTLFNNDIPNPDGNYSAVLQLVPPTDDEGRYLVPDDGPFGPEEPAWTYTAADPASFHSFFISGAHRLPNGHTFVTEGATGRLFEVTPAGEIVWEYRTPFSGPVADGLPARIAPYGIFRATKVEEDHPALAGRTLSPLEPQPPAVLPPELPPEPTDDSAG